MNRCLRAALFLMILVATNLSGADEGIISLADYKAHLYQYEQQIQKASEHPEYAVDFYREVPDQIQVQTLSGTISVPLKFLHDGLENFLKSEPAAKPTILGQLSTRIKTLEAEADNYEKADPGNPMARERLNRILAAREFRNLRGPSEWELLLDRISAWLSEKLNKLFPQAPDLDQAGQIFVWVMIAIACSILAVWLYRASLDRLLDRPREILPFLPSARSWHQWLADARERASAGQWRDAIRLAFWAAVSRLESDGVWRPDKARTPREYLNAIPAGTETKSTFATLTRTFEAAWYGARPVSSSDFDRFLNDLEKLGCRG